MPVGLETIITNIMQNFINIWIKNNIGGSKTPNILNLLNPPNPGNGINQFIANGQNGGNCGNIYNNSSGALSLLGPPNSIMDAVFGDFYRNNNNGNRRNFRAGNISFL